MNYGKMTKAELISKLKAFESGTEIAGCRETGITLHESEEKYRKLIEIANDAIFLVDVETGIIINANKRAEKLLGVPVEKIVGMNRSQMYPPEDIERNNKIFQNYVRMNGAITTEDIFIQHKDGRKIPVEISSNVFELDGRKVLQGIFRDISYHKHVEEKIKLSESRYRSLFNNMLNGYAYCKILVDENNKPIDFVYLEVNDAFEALTGLKKDFVTGRKVADVIPGIRNSEPDLFEIYGKVAMTGVGTRFDIYFEPLEMWLSISVYSPQKGYFVVVFDNITERKRLEEKLKEINKSLEQRAKKLVKRSEKLVSEIVKREQAEETLRESEEKYRGIFERVPVSIILLDRNGQIIDINPYHVSHIGKGKATREDYVGKNVLTHPSIVNAGASEIYADVLKGKPFDLKEVFFPTTTGGTAAYLNVKGVPLLKDGDVIGALTIHEDITERKRAEEKIKELNESLEQRVLERTADLSKANEELKKEITERKKAEEELREAEERLRMAMSAAEMGTWKWDTVTNQDTRDANFNRILGLEAAESTQPVEDFVERVHPEDRAAVDQEIKRSIRERDIYLAEFRIVRPDGTERWLRDQGLPFYDKQDMISYMTGAVVDITERKQAEEELKRSRNSLAHAQQIAHLGSYEWDVVKNETLCSDELYRIHGLEPQQYPLVYEKFLELVHADDREFVRKSVTAALNEGKPYNIEFRIIRPDGSERIVHSEARVIYDKTGKLLRMIGTEQDITERKRAESALKKSEERFDLAAQGTSDGLWEWEINTGKEWWSKRFRELIGYESDELSATYESFKSLLHPEDLEQTLEAVRLHLEAGQAYNIEYRLRHSNSEYRWFLARGIADRNEAGQPIRMAGSIQDINERKRAEDELRKKSSYCKLLGTAAISANEAADIKDAFQPILEEICLYTGWPIGHAYVISKDDPNLLEPTSVWQLEDNKRFTKFCDITAMIKFVKGVGLPGRVLASRKPHWIVDVTKDKNFIRKKIASDMGIKSGIAFPVMIGSKVVAVMTFFTTRALKPDQPFMEIMADVGTQLGRTVERKQAEEMLLNSEERYRSLINDVLDTSNVGVFILDKEFRVVWINKALESYFGLKRDEVIMKNKRQLIKDKIHHIFKDGEKFKERVMNTYDDNTYVENFICQVLPGDGRAERWLEHWSQPIVSGLYAGGRVEHYTDITKRKLAEERIKGLAKFPSENPNPVLRVFNDGRILYNNQASMVLLDSWDCQTTKMLPDNYLKIVSDVLHSGLSNAVEVEFNNCVFSLTFAPVIEEGYVNVYGLDITERKKMEETLLQSEKMKAMGVMTSGVAHEFNNILGIISGKAQLLKEKYSDGKGLAKALHTISRVADDGAKIVDRMYEFTDIKLDSSRLVQVNINDLIKQSIDFTMPRWKNMSQAKGINYYIDVEDLKKIPAILGNPSELREVFVNIINNALDAMPAGGRLTFSTWREDDNVCVNISDTGKGMSEDVKKMIFDPFFTTRSPEGTGLGMSVTYGIITRHNGKIKVESKKGEGSAFTLSLPMANEADHPDVSFKPGTEGKVKNIKILVVDDEQDMCEILSDFFIEDGHEVKIVNNGADGISLLKSEYFDLVLCDLAMPTVTGKDIIKTVHTLDKRPKVGLITGWKYKMEDLKREDLKADFVVKKPFKFSELRRDISNVLEANSRTS